MKKDKGLKWEAAVLAVFSVLAKGLSFGKEIILASFFGAGAILDSYYAGTAFSMFLLFFFSGGAFVPLIISFYSKAKKSDMGSLNTFLLSLLLLSVLLSLLTIVAGEYITFGVRESIKEHTLVVLRITSFASVFYVMSSIIRAMLNAVGKYRASGLQDIIMTVVFIVGAILARSGDAYQILAISFLIGSLARVLVQIPTLLANWRLFSWDVVFDWKSLYRYYRSFLPLMIAVMIPQVFIVLTKNIGASLDDGALSAISFAERTSDLTRSIVATSLGAVLVASFAKMFSTTKRKEFGNLLLKSLSFVMFFSIPISLLFLLYGVEIISFIYGRGNFTGESIVVAGNALKIYSISSLLSSPIYIIVTGLYSSQNTKLFIKTSVISVGAGAVFLVLALPQLGVYALPGATGIYSLFFFMVSGIETLRYGGRTLLDFFSRTKTLWFINIISFGIGYILFTSTNIIFGLILTAVTYILASIVLREENMYEVIDVVKNKIRSRIVHE